MASAKPAGKKGKDKKKKAGTEALAAAFAALEVQPEEEAAEAPAALPEEDANGISEAAPVSGQNYNSQNCTAAVAKLLSNPASLCVNNHMSVQFHL